MKKQINILLIILFTVVAITGSILIYPLFCVPFILPLVIAGTELKTLKA